DYSGSNRYERRDVMIIRVHLRNFSRLEPIDIWQSDRRRRVEDCSWRLNSHNEAGLLTKTGDHRNLVTVNGCHANATGLGAAGEGHLPGAEGEGESRGLRHS